MNEKKNVQSARPYFPDEDINDILKDVEKILRSGKLLGIGGVYTEKFEKMFANYVGTKYAVATNSGTSALHIALRSLNVKRGDEVIVPTNTFIASPNSVIFAGGKPVFADIDRETLSIDFDDASKRITKKTVGIMVVHLHGLICPRIEEFSKLCKDHGLFLIEDAAQAAGATFKDTNAGNLGDVGCFSFYPTKVATTAEGGMICTNRSSLIEKMRVLRFDGMGPEKTAVELGYNWHISELHSILGTYQLKRLEQFLKRRNDIADKYRDGLRGISSVTLFKTPQHIRHCYYKFPVLLDEDVDPEALMQILMTKYGVETGRVYWPTCHLQPIYRELYNYKEGMLPVAEEICRRVICLPIHANLHEKDVDYVIGSLKKAIKECSRITDT